MTNNRLSQAPTKDQGALLHVEGREPVALPIRKGKLGPSVIDVGDLAKLDLYTYDPGFVSTASCSSQITYIDGDQGILLYRGYPIEELAEHADFLEVCYLLMNRELPTAKQRAEFDFQIRHHSMVHEQLIHFFYGFPRQAHPMAIMCGVVGALSAFYHDSLDIYNPEHQTLAALRLIAKMPTLAAMAYKYSIGQPFVYPLNQLNYSENLMRMMFSVPAEEYQVDPVIAKAVDTILILHADHEQNASTSTVRMAGSSGANPFACIAAGITALWGPAHGGANEAVLNMLAEIGDVSKINHYLNKAKDKNDPFRLMGFGHRVYKNFDPRAKVMRENCHKVLDALGMQNDPLFKLALKLEEVALQDDYFVEKKLYPNVDFYSGIILKAIGMPVSLFTVIFALARTVGWISHWNEMINAPDLKISRPRQLYTGPLKRTYVPIYKRADN